MNKFGKILCAIISIALFSCSFESGIKLTFVNHTGKDLKDLNILYNDENKKLKGLKSNQEIFTYIVPKGETSLEVVVILNNNKEERSKLDTYFEEGYTGNIKIEIDKNLQAKIVEQHLNIY